VPFQPTACCTRAHCLCCQLSCVDRPKINYSKVPASWAVYIHVVLSSNKHRLGVCYEVVCLVWEHRDKLNRWGAHRNWTPQVAGPGAPGHKAQGWGCPEKGPGQPNLEGRLSTWDHIPFSGHNALLWAELTSLRCRVLRHWGTTLYKYICVSTKKLVSPSQPKHMCSVVDRNQHGTGCTVPTPIGWWPYLAQCLPLWRQAVSIHIRCEHPPASSTFFVVVRQIICNHVSEV
jgi:hypothetical protein